MADMHDGTGAGLLSFLDWAIRTGELPSATGKGFRTTATKVLSIEDDPDSVDVANLDVERLLERFERLNRENYSTGSMGTYKQRFRQTVTMYKALISGDPKWRKIATRTSAANRQGVRSAATRTISAPRHHDAEQSAALAAPDPDAGMITHTIPLGPGLRARVMLPEHLTMAQARRITAVVNSLAFEEDPASDKEEVTAQDGE